MIRLIKLADQNKFILRISAYIFVKEELESVKVVVLVTFVFKQIENTYWAI